MSRIVHNWAVLDPGKRQLPLRSKRLQSNKSFIYSVDPPVFRFDRSGRAAGGRPSPHLASVNVLVQNASFGLTPENTSVIVSPSPEIHLAGSR